MTIKQRYQYLYRDAEHITHALQRIGYKPIAFRRLFPQEHYLTRSGERGEHPVLDLWDSEDRSFGAFIVVTRV